MHIHQFIQDHIVSIFASALIINFVLMAASVKWFKAFVAIPFVDAAVFFGFLFYDRGATSVMLLEPMMLGMVSGFALSRGAGPFVAMVQARSLLVAEDDIVN